MKTLSTNHIIWHYDVKGTLRAVSPLIIGSGDDTAADVQCVRDGRGALFIPGTSLAGKLRDLAENDAACAAAAADMFGPRNADNGTQSRIIVSDCPLKGAGTGTSTVRDSVRLNDTFKLAEPMGKFDYETIDAGQLFDFHLHVTLRKNQQDQLAATKDLLARLLGTLGSGGFALGAKTGRGFGKVQLAEAEAAEFDFSDETTREDRAEEWLKWERDGRTGGYTGLDLAALPCLTPAFDTFTARFRLPGSLLIRSYTAKPSEPDVVPLSGRGPDGKSRPVIPGTSWGGVFRHALLRIGDDWGARDRMNDLLDALFGHVEVDNERSTHRIRTQGEREQKNFPSNVAFDESLVDGSHCLDYTRNAIDRFTGGVVDSKLFTERLAVGGTVTLTCRLRKKFYEETGRSPDITRDVCAGMICLALLDIGNGLAPVGGSTSVGRGLLELTGVCNDDGDELVRFDGGAALPGEKMQPLVKAAVDYLNAAKGGNS